MQHRNSARSSNGLDRRKSTSSAKSVRLEHIHPDLAERDAQAAAMQAFKRARDRGSAEFSLWPPSRHHSELEARSQGNNKQERVEKKPALSRQQSVRFVRPRPPLTPKANTTTGSYTMPRGGGDSVRRDTSRVNTGPSFDSKTFTSGMASAAKGTAGDYISALLTSEEYYTPEDDIASAPSSYRRIRKCKSMVTRSEPTPAAASYNGLQDDAMANDHLQSVRGKSLISDENKPPAGLRAPKSMSFLKSRRGINTASSVSTESAFSRPKLTTEKTFKKSLRDASDGNPSKSLKIGNDGSLRLKARKASQNFKHKFKSLFNMTKDDKDGLPFPLHQIQTPWLYDVEDDVPAGYTGDVFRVGSPSEEGALSLVASGVPSLHDVPSSQQLRSHQGSVESFRSERKVSDDKSRVTSWGDSDTNTVTTIHSLKRDWERQRLSVIKENGTHISSSSAKRTALTNHPIQINTDVHAPNLTISQPQPTVDGQRIYSALMKRVNGKHKQPNHGEVQRKKSIEDVRKTGAVPPRGSSYHTGSWQLGTPTTIRHVVTTDDSDRDSVRTNETTITRRNCQESQERPSIQTNNANKSASVNKPLPPLDTTPSTRRSKRPGPEVSQLADPFTGRNQSSSQTLSSRKSAFFGSPACHLFRTKSPYRRALQGSMRGAADTHQPKTPEYNPWMNSLSNISLRCPGTHRSSVDPKMQYDKSIYSSPGEGPNDMPEHTAGTGGDSKEASSTRGEATIFLEPPLSSQNPPVPPKERVVSSASSVEWKTWLSANVSKLEGTPDAAQGNEIRYSLPSMSSSSGHVRESAQIFDEDDDKSEALDVYQPTRPDAVVPSTKQNPEPPTYLPRPISKTPAKSWSSDKENEEPKSPPIPPRNASRNTPSTGTSSGTENRGNAKTRPSLTTPLNSTPRQSLPYMRSYNTLRGTQSGESLHLTSKLPRRAKPSRQITPISSPGITAAVEKQFSTLNDSTNTNRGVPTVPAVKSENVSPRVGRRDQQGEKGPGVPGPGADLASQVSGSKRMVDIFLNSRRRKMENNDDGSVFL